MYIFGDEEAVSVHGLHRIHVHVRAVARADDAPGDVLRACVPACV
jgi:hypothetical protein